MLAAGGGIVTGRARDLLSLVGLLGWIARDGLWRHRWRTTWIIGSSLAAAAIQGSALAALFAYARAVERRGAISIPFLPSVPPDETASLVLVAIATAAALGVGAVLLYASRRSAAVLRRTYEEFCMRRALALSSELPHPAADAANRLLSKGMLTTITSKGSRGCAFSADALAMASQPLGRTLVAAAAMSFLSWRYTVLVLAVGAGALMVSGELGRIAGKSAEATRSGLGPALRQRRRLLELAGSAPVPFGDDHEQLTEALRGGAMGRHLDLFYQRVLIRAKSRAVANVVVAVSLPLLFFVAGQAVVSGRWTWTTVGAFLVAARYFFAGLTGVYGLIIRTGRVEPFVSLYRSFVASAALARARGPDGSKPGPLRLLVPSLRPEGPKSLDLEPGNRVVVLGAPRADRTLAALLQTHTESAPDDPPAYWLASAAANGEAPTESHPWVREARGSNRPAVVVAGRHLGPARPVVLDTGGPFADRILFVTADEPGSGQGNGEPVIVLRGGAVVGWAPLGWLRDHPEALDRARRDRDGGPSRSEDEEEEEEEELEEEDF